MMLGANLHVDSMERQADWGGVVSELSASMTKLELSAGDNGTASPGDHESAAGARVCMTTTTTTTSTTSTAGGSTYTAPNVAAHANLASQVRCVLLFLVLALASLFACLLA
jgi:hypothetical protein